MSLSSSLGRQPGHPCAGKKCSATWNASKAWATCWTCPDPPHAFCPACTPKHFNSKTCQRSHKARGAAETDDQQHTP